MSRQKLQQHKENHLKFKKEPDARSKRRKISESISKESESNPKLDPKNLEESWKYFFSMNIFKISFSKHSKNPQRKHLRKPRFHASAQRVIFW